MSASTQLTNWTTASPFYTGTGFNATTGNYTVPTTGRYSILATISYSTTASLTASIGASVSPQFVIMRSSPTTTNLVTGNFPVLDVNVALVLTLRVILGTATVTMTGEYSLNAGDVIGIYYVANGLTVNLNLGGASTAVTTWAIHEMT
ncbi:hypothetical protein SAMN05880570_3283 [Paenibacillus sp. RU4T]|nr:hypothetical protein SAMN05880555_2715 [Paenibacillus sp. RU4X]SIR35017.1 hypothetical protein SAMN05880570_3283 [Paenibacillus sp. RU4T]